LGYSKGESPYAVASPIQSSAGDDFPANPKTGA